MRSWLWIGAVVSIMNTTEAQWDPRSIARANATGVGSTDVWIGSDNPASVAFYEAFSASASFVPAPFGLSELRRIGCSALLPMQGCVVRGTVRASGRELYHEVAGCADLGFRVAPKTTAGIAVALERLSFLNYEGLTRGRAVLGLVSVGDQWSVGARVSRELRADPRRTSSVNIATGVTIRPTGTIRCRWELEQGGGESRLLRFAVDVEPVEHFAVYLGWSDEVPLVSSGFALRFNDVETSFGAQFRTELGWVIAVGLSYGPGEGTSVR